MKIITQSMKILSNGIQLYLGLTIYLYNSVSSMFNNSRINHGGSAASIYEAPWTVALGKTVPWMEFGVMIFCTGTIIEANWILTAAHCVIKDRAEPSKLLVIAGMDDAYFFTIKDLVQRRAARRIHYHPDYKTTVGGSADIALIYIDELNFSNDVKPVNLWAVEWPGPASLVMCKAFGWGLKANEFDDKGREKTYHLRKSNITAQHGRCECFRMRNTQRRILCSHPSSAGGICGGDSGGPLICNNKLAGVAHAVMDRDCRVFLEEPRIPCNSPKTVSLWIYVCPMLGFIRHHVPSVPVHPESCTSPRFSANFRIIFWFPTFIRLLNS